MKKKTIFIIIILSAIFVFGLSMGVLKVLDIVFAGACGNEIVREVPSPSGKKVAYVFTRDCGATTGYSPQLSILNKGDHFENESGNAFRLDKAFSVEWVNENKLTVTYDQSSEIYKIDKKVNGVTVEYESE
jgi:hypothetical protein